MFSNLQYRLVPGIDEKIPSCDHSGALAFITKLVNVKVPGHFLLLEFSIFLATLWLKGSNV